MKAGTSIKPFHIPLIAACGKTTAAVYHRPAAAILLTGDELVPPGRIPQPGQIRETNGLTLRYLLKKYGISCRGSSRVKDTEPAVCAAVQKAVGRAHIVLVSGGVSVGAYDFGHIAIKKVCRDILFEKIAMKPGKPCILGRTHKNVHVFGIPGNPVSTLVVFEMLIIPLIKKISGYNTITPPVLTAKLTKPYKKQADRLHFAPGSLSVSGSDTVFTPFSYHDSGDVFNASAAQMFMVAAREKTYYRKGEKITVFAPGSW